MKKLIIASLLILISANIHAQVHSAVSQPQAFRITREIKPPILNIEEGTIKFIDASGNNAIDANEMCYIELMVTNTGIGEAYGCVATISATGAVLGLSYANTPINILQVGRTQLVKIPITTSMITTNGMVEFAVSINEPNGFGTDPQYISVKTRAFDAPWLQITDYTVTGITSTLEKKRPFDLQVLLQNTKHGTAEQVTVEISLPSGVLLFDGKQSESFATIEGGKTQSLVYSLIANNNYTAQSIPITITITEKHRLYAESRTINLALNQTLASNKITVDEVLQQRDAITIASLSSDVDKNIPHGGVVQPNTFAVIIANEGYRREAKVDFAQSDGEIFRQYCTQTLGLPEKNVRFYSDATLNDIRAGVNWLEQVASAFANQAKIIFYYAGHGIPDERYSAAYLLPVDGYGSDVQTGYPISDLYKKFAAFPAESVVVFLDACFSGAQRNGEMLASARGVAIKTKQEVPAGNTIVFSAAQGDETAFPYVAQNHGLFTYFLLKKLQTTKGNVTLGELSDYIYEKVRQRSIVENSKSQTPSIIPSRAMQNWRDAKL